MYNPNVDHGAAEYLNWVELTQAEADALSAAEPVGDRTDKLTYLNATEKFASLVKIVNASEISGGGGGGGVVSDISYNRIIYVDGTVNPNETYIMETANMSANPSDAAWRARKIYGSGSQSHPTTGSGFNNVATDLATVKAFTWQLDGNGF
jgi:hypothetical protein